MLGGRFPSVSQADFLACDLLLTHVRDDDTLMIMAGDRSRLRQGIHTVESERDQQLKVVLAERGPLVRGSVVIRQRVCGHPECRCATEGQLHVSPYLSVTVDGKTQAVHLPAADEQHVRKATERYRRFRQARARLVQLATKQLKLVDRLGNALLEGYPRGEPVQPPGRRGPKPKKGRRRSR